MPGFPVVPFYPFWEGSPTKIDTTEERVPVFYPVYRRTWCVIATCLKSEGDSGLLGLTRSPRQFSACCPTRPARGSSARSAARHPMISEPSNNRVAQKERLVQSHLQALSILVFPKEMCLGESLAGLVWGAVRKTWFCCFWGAPPLERGFSFWCPLKQAAKWCTANGFSELHQRVEKGQG